jgi:hypothetical protein
VAPNSFVVQAIDDNDGYDPLNVSLLEISCTAQEIITQKLH